MMEQKNGSDLKRGIDIKPGIFVVRYAIAEEVSAHPAIKVSVDDENAQKLSLILSEGSDIRDVTLWRPGTGVVLKATQAGKIHVEVVPIQSDASTNATIKIDAITQGDDSYEVLGQPAGLVKKDLDLSGFKLQGHVAGRGDIEVPADEWLAGPQVPARIEGIAIDWLNKPRNLDLRYCAIGPRSNAANTPMVPLGNFAGSRGRALPVLGLSLELTGSGTHDMQLVAEALFLGTPVIRLTGERIALAGPSGLEPLIGLKLSIEPKQQVVQDEPQEPAEAPAAEATRPVRVFRSKRSSAG